MDEEVRDLAFFVADAFVTPDDLAIDDTVGVGGGDDAEKDVVGAFVGEEGGVPGYWVG